MYVFFSEYESVKENIEIVQKSVQFNLEKQPESRSERTQHLGKITIFDLRKFNFVSCEQQRRRQSSCASILSL